MHMLLTVRNSQTAEQLHAGNEIFGYFCLSKEIIHAYDVRVCVCLASSWQGIFRMTSETNQLAVWLIQAFTVFTRSTSNPMSFGVFLLGIFFPVKKWMWRIQTIFSYALLCHHACITETCVWAYCLKFFSRINCKPLTWSCKISWFLLLCKMIFSPCSFIIIESRFIKIVLSLRLRIRIMSDWALNITGSRFKRYFESKMRIVEQN